MDFHAHLCLSEVIGVLAGVFDPTNRTVRCDQAGYVQHKGRVKIFCTVENPAGLSCMALVLLQRAGGAPCAGSEY